MFKKEKKLISFQFPISIVQNVCNHIDFIGHSLVYLTSLLRGRGVKTQSSSWSRLNLKKLSSPNWDRSRFCVCVIDGFPLERIINMVIYSLFANCRELLVRAFRISPPSVSKSSTLSLSSS